VRRPRLIGLFLAACLIIVAATSVAAIIRDAADTPGLIAMLADFVVYAAAWWLFTTQLPHGDASYVALIPGALLFGAGIQALHLVTVYFLARRITSASELYGTLGVSAALLLGLFVVGRLIVFSAELNQSIGARHPASGGDRG
jgi:membrane protein